MERHTTDGRWIRRRFKAVSHRVKAFPSFRVSFLSSSADINNLVRFSLMARYKLHATHRALSLSLYLADVLQHNCGCNYFHSQWRPPRGLWRRDCLQSTPLAGRSEWLLRAPRLSIPLDGSCLARTRAFRNRQLLSCLSAELKKKRKKN